jgi:hypothetical protein
MSNLAVGLLAACDDDQLFAFPLWSRQRQLLAALEQGKRIHVWALGRRSGKSTLSALVCLWDALLRPDLDSMVRAGETRFAVAVATNHAQARLIVSAARSIVERSPLLSPLLDGATDDELRFILPSGAKTAIRAFPCTSRGGRGWPISCLVMDETAHFMDSEGFQAAERVWGALTPSTAQFGTHARIIMASTPYGTAGLFADMHARASAGSIDDAEAQHATSAEVNPTLDAAFLAQEEARDPDNFRAEYMAEFTGSGDAFLDFARIDDDARLPPQPPAAATSWVAGLDPAFSKDPFGYALVGRTSSGQLIVGPIGALRAQGDFGGPVDEVAGFAKEYKARAIVDQFSSAAVVERLQQKHHITTTVNTMSATSKTEIFQSLRAALYDGSLTLPDNPALLTELRRLRTRFSAGQSSVVNPRVGGSHGDIAQALAMAVHALSGAKGPGAAYKEYMEAELKFGSAAAIPEGYFTGAPAAQPPEEVPDCTRTDCSWKPSAEHPGYDECTNADCDLFQEVK